MQRQRRTRQRGGLRVGGGGLGVPGRPLRRGLRLLAGLHPVDSLEVPLHVTLLVKGGGTRRTRVRPRPAVDAHVPLQVVLLVAAVETLAAGGARGEGGGGGGGVVALLAPLQDKATLRPPPALPPPLRMYKTTHTCTCYTPPGTSTGGRGPNSRRDHAGPAARVSCRSPTTAPTHDSPQTAAEVTFLMLTD